MEKFIKKNTQLYVSESGNYAITGRYTYYQGWTACYLPQGERGEWVQLDGIYKGKGSLETCRELCQEHSIKHSA